MNNRNEVRDRGIVLGVYHTQLLLEALERNVATITAAKCAQWYRFMQTYLPRCPNGAAIEGYWLTDHETLAKKTKITISYWKYIFV